MGTNYYVEYQAPPWNTEPATLHVGKSSAGWVFCFHAATIGEGQQMRTTEDWRLAIAGLVTHGPCRLADEYGKEITPLDFFAKVLSKSIGCTRHIGREYGCWTDGEGNDFDPGEFC